MSHDLNLDELIKESEKKLIESSSQIANLEKMDIIKNTYYQGNKDSQTIVTYPPTRNMPPIAFKDVYNVPDELNKRNTLYIHIPFCTGVCSYCAYARTVKKQDDPVIEQYINALEQEASLLVNIAGQKRILVESIYIGGGTPTIFCKESLDRLFKLINKYFCLQEHGEYSLEGSPETITLDKIKIALKNGVNRISFGAESFDNETLVRMRRRHDVDAIFKAIDCIRKGGIDNIDFDLIRGFDGQTKEKMYLDILAIKKTEVPSVTSYQYIIKGNTIDSSRIGSKYNLKYYDQLFLHIMFKVGLDWLGYREYPVNFFHIDPKYTYKHQILKWKDMTNQLVLGQGSYGYLNNIQFINETGKKYYRKIENNKMPVAYGFKLNIEEVMRRSIIFGLKTGIDRKEFSNTYGMDIMEAPFGEIFQVLENAGGIEINEDHINLSEMGYLIADCIQECFYSNYFIKSKNV